MQRGRAPPVDLREGQDATGALDVSDMDSDDVPSDMDSAEEEYEHVSSADAKKAQGRGAGVSGSGAALAAYAQDNKGKQVFEAFDLHDDLNGMDESERKRYAAEL